MRVLSQSMASLHNADVRTCRSPLIFPCCPKGPSTPFFRALGQRASLRTLGLLWVPSTIKQDYLDPYVPNNHILSKILSCITTILKPST